MIQEWELEELDERSTPLANLGVLVAAIGGAGKPEQYRDMINPYGFVLKRQQARSTIDPKSAKLAIDLNQKGLIPSWARSMIDWDLINLSAGD